MRWFVAISLFVSSVHRCQAESAPDAKKEHIANLIRQLGHDEFGKRESASIQLEDIGEAALPALRQARTEDDPEVQLRVRRLLTTIILGCRESRSTRMSFVVIDPGEFQMGSPNNESGRLANEWRHQVRITKPFLLGTHEVTQEVFEQIMGFNPSSFARTGESKAKVAGTTTKRFPVESVSWYDAVAFCNRLSERDGFPPYYRLDEVKVDGKSIIAAKVTREGGNGYRLPTEAEWEYACRARTTTPFHYGTRNTGKEANIKATRYTGGYGSSSVGWKDLKRPTTVGSYPTNEWNLRDMHGNVTEWCWDWYDADYYRTSPLQDPNGPKTGTHRVARGGSWLLSEKTSRSASRFYHTPDERKNYTGFRVARSP